MKKHRIALIALALSAVAYADAPRGDLPMAPDESTAKHLVEDIGSAPAAAGAKALYNRAFDRGHMQAAIRSESVIVPPRPIARPDAKFQPRLIAEEGRYELMATSATFVNGRKIPDELKYDLVFIGTRLTEVRPTVCQRTVTHLTDKVRMGWIESPATELRTTTIPCPGADQ